MSCTAKELFCGWRQGKTPRCLVPSWQERAPLSGQHRAEPQLAQLGDRLNDNNLILMDLELACHSVMNFEMRRSIVD